MGKAGQKQDKTIRQLEGFMEVLWTDTDK
jgi:hypothetical protein